VGAGLAGLSATLHLTGGGVQSVVLEAAADPGGVMGRIERDGYTFDTGPTVLTMPSLIEDCLAAVGEECADWLTLTRVDPSYLARFADGTTLRSFADTDRMTEEVGRVFGAAEANGYRALTGFLAELFDAEYQAFMASNVDRLADLLRPEAVRLVRLGALRSLDHAVGRYVRDERLRRMFTFQALYAGVSPYRARAIYAVIAYLDSLGGVWYPDGGMYRVPAALAGAATRHGARIRYRTRATSIEIRGNRVVAVHTDAGERIEASAVIYAGDLAAGYRDLLPPGMTPRSLRRAVAAPSAFVWHVGSRSALPEQAHHQISFGTGWRSSFRDIIVEGRLMTDPSMLITHPTATDPSMAPAGRHSYYVLVPCPNIDVGPLDWKRIASSYRDEVALRLAERGYDTDGAFSTGVEVSVTVSPREWQAAGLAAGTPFGLAHTLTQTGPFRHPTQHPRVANLFFCGASCQPGVGIPPVLLSGRSAATRLLAGISGRRAVCRTG
jgi:phytoene desaturase